jgi:hypothetical protein
MLRSAEFVERGMSRLHRQLLRIGGWVGRFPLRAQLLIGVAILSALLSWAVRPNPWRALRDVPKPLRPVAVVRLSDEAFTERVRALQAVEVRAEDMKCRRLGLLDLGLVSALEPKVDVLPESLFERVQGHRTQPAFYRVGSDTVFFVVQGDPTVAHELVHALEDQHSERMRAATAAQTLDERIALRAASEATAVLVSGGAAAPLRFGTNYDYNAYVLAYGFGPAYARRAAPGRTFQDLLALHPGSTREVMFGAPPTQRESAPAAELSEDEALLCSDRLGALGLLSALNASGVPSEMALQAAEAWVDDRMDVIRTPDGQRRTAWSVRFDSAEAARIWSTGPASRLRLTSDHLHLDTHLTRSASGHSAPGEAPAPSPLGALGR